MSANKISCILVTYATRAGSAVGVAEAIGDTLSARGYSVDVKPIDEVFFSGVIDPNKLSLVDRLMVKMVKSPVGDFRNWDKISGWAQSFPA